MGGTIAGYMTVWLLFSAYMLFDLLLLAALKYVAFLSVWKRNTYEQHVWFTHH